MFGNRWRVTCRCPHLIRFRSLQAMLHSHMTTKQVEAGFQATAPRTASLGSLGSLGGREVMMRRLETRPWLFLGMVAPTNAWRGGFSRGALYPNTPQLQ